MEATSIFVRPRPALARAVEGVIERGEVASAPVRLKPGDHLFRVGDTVSQTFYLARGLIKLYATNAAGDSKTVFLHRAGSLIGFQTMQQPEVENGLSILNAQATAVCEVHALDAAQFRRYLTQHGDVCYEMACYLFDMMSDQTRENVNSSTCSVLQRFAALLLAIARELRLPQAPAVVPFTNADLASMLGVHPNSVTNATAALRRAECVERQHGCLLITDYRKLKQVAGNLVRDDG